MKVNEVDSCDESWDNLALTKMPILNLFFICSSRNCVFDKLQSSELLQQLGGRKAGCFDEEGKNEGPLGVHSGDRNLSHLLGCVLYLRSVLLHRKKGPTDNFATVEAQRIFQVIFFFGMSNSVLNPIVYGAFHMARRSQSAWRKWYKRFPSVTSVGGRIHGEPNVFSPLRQEHNSINSRASSLRVISRPPSRMSVGKTPSLDV
ncbi:hypothetical protein BV898_14917 [Hypsibius exemplaris]|uniref:G-protein coupled receptors family 1 profile domain-containing protein n=1 Tax=Hypsibius exemplaris TaxID=2072580 RepID=A0A9X6NBY0_HYPEX|nr:hypothetical protein BV898_14917 [Hypsibius exemplaris]